MRPKRYGLLPFLLVLAYANAFAAGGELSEEQLVAKILVQFPRYVTFASPPKARPVLCIAGDKDLYAAIDSINAPTKAYDQAKLVIDPKLSNGCDLIYTPDTRIARELILKTADQRTLVLSNYPSFIEEGGGIAIVNVNGKIAIELNLSVIREKRITLSPDLIELSTRIIQ